jgi:molecular chaperone DnaK (HSP70)
VSTKFVIGIDLGTSNCAVAYVEPSAGASAPIRDFPVRQFVRPGETQDKPLFPSVVYQSFEGEFPAGSLGTGPIVGEFARFQAGRVPGRAVTSAKSWLIHAGVDRQAPILPWGAPTDVARMSPVAAQAALLKHLAESWNAAHPEAPLNQQEVVLTIPASFDEAARALTLQAARDAGFELGKLTLLEEPQAAFYDFTSRHRTSLAKALSNVGLVLVVDVGGGTTDFSLVKVAMLAEGPALERLAVGDHLLLGGDNMDAALARVIEGKVLRDGARFTGAQWSQALQVARVAKEALLSDGAPTSAKISIASGGSKLIGGTLTAEFTKDEVREVVANGFFPPVTPESVPSIPKRGAVVELGLPFAQDAAITRHVVAFLKAHGAGQFPRPDAILLNGGVFNSPVLTKALIDSVSALWPDRPTIPTLPHDSLDLAVARGAAYSGLARRALGKKIGGGAPRAFYALVGPSPSPPAGERLGERGDAAVCLIPRGFGEGETITLDRTFQLTIGRPVQFQLFSTTADRLDRAGGVIQLDDEHFKALPPIHTILGTADVKGGKLVGSQLTVQLVATLTEVGTIALSCVSGDQRWRLEFELRGSAKSNELTVTESMPARFSEATLEIDRVFGTKPLPVEPKDVKNLFRTLEKILGPRESWTVPVLRELWTPLWSGVTKRRRSADHEKVMFQLLGYSLRPGIGYPLDQWRVEQTSTLFKDLLTNHGEQPIWIEFWVLWRRIASGLNETAQLAIWNVLKPHLLRRVPVGLPPPKDKVKGVQPQGLDEMVRCAAALELLPQTEKAELGGWIVSRLDAGETVGGPWAWSLGRLGARVPVHGAAHRVLTPDVAEKWVEVLLKLDHQKHDGAPFALTLLARRTGDRSRDVSDDLRNRVLAALAKAPESWRQLVAEVVQLSAADEARALGDSLPLGLTI